MSGKQFFELPKARVLELLDTLHKEELAKLEILCNASEESPAESDFYVQAQADRVSALAQAYNELFTAQ